MILSRSIKRVEKLIDFIGKIWKSELLKVINNKTWRMLILTYGFIGGKYPRHFLFNFCQWISFPFFHLLKSSKNMFKIPIFCAVFIYPIFIHTDFKS